MDGTSCCYTTTAVNFSNKESGYANIVSNAQIPAPQSQNRVEAPSRCCPEERDWRLALHPQLVCDSWMSGLAEVVWLLFLRNVRTRSSIRRQSVEPRGSTSLAGGGGEPDLLA